MAVPTTGRLPVRLTPLVGRDRDLDEVARALAGGRLLTLTGPGGVGKTRLALAVAVRLTAQNADVAWADLAQVSDPVAIEQTVAATLGARASPGPDPFAAVAAHLAASRGGNARPPFIVLDGCEHATVKAEVGETNALFLVFCCGSGLCGGSGSGGLDGGRLRFGGFGSVSGGHCCFGRFSGGVEVLVESVWH